MKNKYSLRNAISKTVRGGLFVGLSVLSMGLFNQVSAQVSAYTFSQSTGTYTEITGGTVLATCNACATTFDSQLFTVTLATPFSYNGTNVTNIQMGVDGMLLLGTTTGTSTTAGISSSQALTGIISALNMDLRNTNIAGQTYELRYQDIGPEHVFQWKNASRWSQDLVERFSFQIRINKSTNVISVVYGEMIGIAASTTYIPQVGLRGATNSDFNSRRLTTTVPTSTPTWDNTSPATLNSHNLRFTSTNPAAFPSNGLTFVWTAPSCFAPSGITSVSGTTSASISWTAPGITPSNGYQYEVRTSGAAGSGPTGLVNSGTTAAGVTTTNVGGLTNGTTYTVYLRSDCGGTFSGWTSGNNFTTSCKLPTAITVDPLSITTTGASFSWTAANPAPATGYEYEVRTSGSAGSGATGLVASGTTAAGITTASISGLSASTSYFIYVRSNCGSGDFSSWTTASTFNTVCLVTTIPTVLESFETTNALPVCWSRSLIDGTTQWATTTTNDGVPSARTGTRLMGKTWNNSNALVVSQEIDFSSAANGSRINVWIYRNSVNAATDRIRFYVNDAPDTTTASLLLEIFPKTNVAPTVATNGWYNYVVNIPASFNSITSGYIVALGTTSAGINSYGIGFDDFMVEEIPNCLEPTAPISLATSATTATFSWTAPTTAPADGYQYEIRTSGAAGSGATGLTTSGSVSNSVLSVNITSLTPNTNYTAFVRANCGLNNFSSWTPVSNFFTGYCTPAPSSVDGNGIVQVKLNSIDNASTAETGNYGDYSAQSTDVVIGVLDTVQITYATGYTYGTKIWIDFNNNLVFEASELIYTGLSTNTNPTTLNAPFTIPLSVTPGSYRMRIGGTDDNAGPSSACYTGTFGSFEDYTVNVLCPATIPTITASTTDDVCSGGIAELTVTGKVGATFNWYSSQVAGTLIETDDTLTTTALTATTSYWVEQVYPTCGASARTEVIATVSPVNVTLTPINNTCNGYAAGSFALGTVNCGTAPFEYSVNGGAFGAIPTNLAAGTYSIIAKDATTAVSQPISLVIGQPSTVIPTPTVSNASVCEGSTSKTISAVGIPITQSTPVVVSFDITAQPVETNAAPGNVLATATMPTLPAGAVVTSATLSVPNITANGNSYQSEVRLGLSGALVNNEAAGTGAAFTPGNFNYTRTFVPTVGTGSTINILYWDSSNDVVPGNDATFTTGTGTATLTLTYTIPSDVTWWTAATGGTQIGTTASIEAIGSPVMASPAVAGTYTFYVQTETGTCSSVTRAPLTVTVTALPTPTVTASNPTLCDGSSIFLISSSATGNVWSTSPTATNDSLSVNAAGSYTVTVTDANGCVGTSAPYVTTITALPVVSAGIDQTVCANSSVTLVGTGAPTLVWNNNVTNNTPFTATATTTYTVTGTAANGCVNTDNVTVTVNALPVPTITGDLVICSGDSTLLISSSETGNVWSTSATATNDSIYVSAAGTYTVTQTDANGCIGTSAPVTVVVNALPSVNAGNDFAVCQNGQAILSASGASTYTWNNNVTNNASFVVTQTTTYTVTGTDANGCQNTDDVTITTTALPAVEAGSNITQCGEQTVTLTATGATVYSWNNNVTNGTAFEAPFGTSVYLVTGVDANGCANTDAVTVTIYEEPTATISVVSGVTLQASPANASYQWINCADESPIVGATSSVFTPTENGSYAVIVTGMGGCENTSACFNVTSVGVDKVELGSAIQLYPNPTTGDVFVNMNTEINASVVVMDAQGKIVLTQNGLSNGSSIQLGNFENGVYMIQVNSEIGSKVFRIVKN